MSKKKTEFEIIPVKELPIARKQRQTIYDDLLKSLEKQAKGYYEVKIGDKKSKTMYSALVKRLKERKDMKLHSRGEKLFIERL